MTELADTARVRAAHERFVTTGQLSSRAVRSVVADSWRRSLRSGVDPEVQNAPVDMARQRRSPATGPRSRSRRRCPSCASCWSAPVPTPAG